MVGYVLVLKFYSRHLNLKVNELEMCLTCFSNHATIKMMPWLLFLHNMQYAQ